MSDLGAMPDDSNSLHVLIVEDDPIFGRALEAGLLMDGISVEWSHDGSDALRVFEPGRYDALLVDLGLPTVSGFDIVRRIRRQDPDVTILIVTGEDAVVNRVRGLDLGADDYLVKPFEMQELLARIRAVKRRRTGGASTNEHGSATVVELGSEGTQRDLELTSQELANAGPLLACPQSVSAAAVAILLRQRGESLSLTEVQACLLSMQAKFEERLPQLRDEDAGTIH